MAKLLRNITLQFIRLNRIDSLYDPQSIRITYYEQNVKRGRALFLFSNCLDSSGREKGDRICCYTTTLWSLVCPLYLLTMLSFTVRPTLTWLHSDVTLYWTLQSTLYCPVLGPLLCHHNKGLFILHSVRWLGASANMYFSL